MGSMRNDGSAGTGVLHRFGNATRMMRTSVPVTPPTHPSRSTQSDILLARPLRRAKPAPAGSPAVEGGGHGMARQRHVFGPSGGGVASPGKNRWRISRAPPHG